MTAKNIWLAENVLEILTEQRYGALGGSSVAGSGLLTGGSSGLACDGESWGELALWSSLGLMETSLLGHGKGCVRGCVCGVGGDMLMAFHIGWLVGCQLGDALGLQGTDPAPLDWIWPKQNMASP